MLTKSVDSTTIEVENTYREHVQRTHTENMYREHVQDRKQNCHMFYPYAG